MAAGDITDSLVEELGMRLEDQNEAVFTAATKIRMLNHAQKELAGMIHNDYLSELEELAEDVNVDGTDGYANFSTIDANGIFKGNQGIINVKAYAGGAGSGVYAIRVDVKDLSKQRNSYVKGTDLRPAYYVFNEKIYMLMDTFTDTNVDVWYLREPNTMSTSVDPLISTSLHPIMLDIAEAMCWGMDAKGDRRAAAWENALMQIKALNEKYETPQGVGQRNRG